MATHLHYNLEAQTDSVKNLVANRKLTGPTFVGQGISRSVGSDCYGYYVIAINKSKSGKPIVGITQASTRFAKDWTDGDEECSLDPKAEVSNWLTTYGKHWYYCDKNGKRFAGAKAKFGWNGCRAYRDPSF